MKNLLLLFLSVTLYTDFAYAQKINIKKGIAYADDSAYCKVSGKTGFAGSMETSFSIAGMDDTELIFVRENREEGIYEFSFLSFNQRIKISKAVFGSNWKTSIVKALFKNKVINDNKLNEGGKNNFVIKFEYYETKDNNTAMVNTGFENGSSNTSQIKLAERNQDAEIFISGNDIRQDFMLIGTFISKTSMNKNNDIIRTFIIKLPGGAKAAELKINEFKAEDNSLYIFRNDKTISVTALKGLVAGNDEIMKRVAEVLVENKSL
jgi:hypothetical protein